MKSLQLKCSISSNNYHYWVNVSFQENHILSTWKSTEWVDWFPSELNIRPLLSLKPGNAVGFKYVTNASVIVLHYLVQGNTRQILLQNFNNSYVKMASNTYTIHRNLIKNNENQQFGTQPDIIGHTGTPYFLKSFLWRWGFGEIVCIKRR